MSAPLGLYILTFNCGRALIDSHLFASHFFQAWPEDKAVLPDVIAVSLQEVSPIAYSFLGGAWLDPYLQRVEEAVTAATKTRQEHGNDDVYETLIVRNLGMTVLMLFVKKEVRGRIKWIQTAGCGVGVWDMGNKGAVGMRLGLDDGKELTFVAMHLAPMESAVHRRNEDWKSIVQNLVFENVSDLTTRPKAADVDVGESEPLLSGPRNEPPNGVGLYKPKNFIFLAGDLNYRTSLVPPTLQSVKTYPQPAKFGASPANGERISLETLWTRDQLSQQLAAGRTLQGFTEAPIKFAPTYKYENEKIELPGPKAVAKDPSDNTTAPAEDMNDVIVQEPEQWTWAKHRWPSWCDRILFLPSNGVTPHLYDALPLLTSSDHRAVALSLTIPAGPAEDVEGNDFREVPPFSLSTDWKARRATSRSLEMAVGIASYLVLTTEGYAILVGLFGGAIGGYILIKALI